MKKLSWFLMSLTFLVAGFSSCSSKDDNEPEVKNGLENVYVLLSDAEEAEEFPAKQAGPYALGSTIEVPVPTSEEVPVDLTKCLVRVSLANDWRVVSDLTQIIDLSSEPFTITISKGSVVEEYKIKAVPTLPKTRVKTLWAKTYVDLGLTNTHFAGMAIKDNQLLINECGRQWDASFKVRAYNYLTGEYANKELPVGQNLHTGLAVDAGGNIISNRCNESKAGIVFRITPNMDTPFQELYYCPADDYGLDAFAGDRMSVCGNLKSGVGYAYAVPTGSKKYYRFKFEDGELAEEPEALVYGNAPGNWKFAQIKRASVDENSEHYMTYYIDGGAADEELKKGSIFEIFDNMGNVTRLARENYVYGILDFEVFAVGNDTFLAILEQQGRESWAAKKIKIFNITDREKMSMKPGEDGYRDFCVYETTGSGYNGANFNSWGNLAVKVDGNKAYIFMSICHPKDGENLTFPSVVAYELTNTEK